MYFYYYIQLVHNQKIIHLNQTIEINLFISQAKSPLVFQF